MKKSVSILILFYAIVCGLNAAPASRNLFAELLGKSETEVGAKLDAAWQQLFYGDDKNQRVYFPVGDDLAYIADIGSNDVRSEGMSYGMMIAVQLNHRAEFDRLWKWANKYMRHDSGPRRGYFAWQCKYDGTQLDPGSASDGEEWFAMALFFAAHRWDDSAEGKGIFNYGAEAQALLEAMRRNDRGGGITAIFDLTQKQVVFAPSAGASTFTDPSYHLPAFYILWARWDRSPEGREFWANAAITSRAFFARAANPANGLMPEYAHFDGSPFADKNFGAGKNDFRYDAWRTLANVALDHAWFAADPWQGEQSNRILRFLAAQSPIIPDQFTLEGKALSTDESIGLIAMAAVAGLAADPTAARPFVQKLWDAPIPSGRWRYYNGLLYTLGLLEAGGHFKIYSPHTP